MLDAAVGATLRVQWGALESREAREVLEVASLLGEAEMIPRARLSLLTGLGEMARPGRPARLTRALKELWRLSLVEELTAEAIRLHPLVRAFAAAQIEGPEAFRARCTERLLEALGDMGRLHEEVSKRGVDAVLEDLRVGRKLAGTASKERFEALIRPLDREAHALRGWDPGKVPAFFLQQLRNRCFEMGIEDVRARAEAGANIRRLRRKQRLTQQQAADAAELDIRHYQRAEHGQLHPKLSTLAALANALGVDVTVLERPPRR